MFPKTSHSLSVSEMSEAIACGQPAVPGKCPFLRGEVLESFGHVDCNDRSCKFAILGLARNISQPAVDSACNECVAEALASRKATA